MRNVFTRTANILILLLFSAFLFTGCGGRDPKVVGKWVATGIEISKWDIGGVPPEKERTFEFFEDGAGTHVRHDKESTLTWSTGNQAIKVDYDHGDDETFQYSFKDGQLVLIQENNEKFFYTKR